MTQKEEQQIDDKTFGKLIQEDIDRINEQSGNSAPTPPVSRQVEQIKPQTAMKPVSGAQSSVGSQPQTRTVYPPPPVNHAKPVYSPPVNNTQPRSSSSVYKAQPMVNIPQEKPVHTGSSTSSVYKEKPMVQAPPVSQPKTTYTSAAQKPETNKPVGSAAQFARLDDFMIYLSGNGITVKDNREKGGCLWVKADPRIDGIIKKQIFGDRGFKYSEKSKALGGQPGWYY